VFEPNFPGPHFGIGFPGSNFRIEWHIDVKKDFDSSSMHMKRKQSLSRSGKSALAFLLLLVQIAASAASADPLQGGVKHDVQTPITGDIWSEGEREMLPAGLSFADTVPPVGPDLKPHKLFSSVLLPAEDKEDTWYQIPKWRAGFFHREKQIDHTQFGDRESVSKVDHLYGMQVDKNGGIWHHMSWPKITKVSMDGYSQYKIINKYEPVIRSNNEFCVKISSTNLDVDDKTGKITRVGKQEEIDRYFPHGTDSSVGYCLIQGYSQHGRPNTELEKCSVEETKLKPFSVLNNFRGKDLRESFINYLKAHEMEDLLPAAGSTSF